MSRNGLGRGWRTRGDSALRSDKKKKKQTKKKEGGWPERRRTKEKEGEESGARMVANKCSRPTKE